jgi:hypothetical protein
MDVNNDQHQPSSLLGWILSIILFAAGKSLPILATFLDDAIAWVQLLCFITSLALTLMTIVINWKKFIDKWNQLKS